MDKRKKRGRIREFNEEITYGAKNQEPKKASSARVKDSGDRFLLKKLYTKSARRLFREIQKSEPESWHLSANKWVKLKNAGR